MVDTSNPWKTLSSQLVYENAWIRVREDQVIRPDGNPGIYGVVDTRIATGVIALTPENEIYIVGQYRYPTDMYSWEIIEGGADDNETPLTAAKRELREEAGIIANSWEQLGDEIHTSNCFTSEIGFFFVARDLTEVGHAPEATEVLTVRKVPFRDCVAMVDSGEIKDAMSIMAILRFARLHPHLCK